MPMTNTSTPCSLIAFLYRETNPEETRAIQQDLAIDTLLREDLEALRFAKRALPGVTFSPADRTLENILAYSAALAVEA